jgi:hypothetical protein
VRLFFSFVTISTFTIPHTPFHYGFSFSVKNKKSQTHFSLKLLLLPLFSFSFNFELPKAPMSYWRMKTNFLARCHLHFTFTLLFPAMISRWRTTEKQQHWVEEKIMVTNLSIYLMEENKSCAYWFYFRLFVYEFRLSIFDWVFLIFFRSKFQNASRGSDLEFSFYISFLIIFFAVVKKRFFWVFFVFKFIFPHVLVGPFNFILSK